MSHRIIVRRTDRGFSKVSTKNLAIRAARPGPVNSGAAPSDPDSHRQKAPPQLIAGREPPRDLLGALRQSLDKYEALHGQPLALDTSVQLP